MILKKMIKIIFIKKKGLENFWKYPKDKSDQIFDSLEAYPSK